MIPIAPMTLAFASAIWLAIVLVPRWLGSAPR